MASTATFHAVITDRTRHAAPDADRLGPYVTRDLFVTVLADDDSTDLSLSLDAFYMADALTFDGMVLSLDLVAARF